MEQAAIRGATLEYEILGSAEPVLLIHGVLVADAFRPLVEEASLAGRYRMIVYHRRGAAGSDRVTPPFSIKDQAADAQGLLEELGIERAHIVGHSYGAAIVLQLAVDAPQLVHTLALLEAPSVSVPSAAQVVEAMGPVGERFASGDKRGAADDFLTAMGGAGYREPLDRLLPGSFEQAVADADALFTTEFPALGEWGITADDVSRIHGPVLRIVGENTIPWFVESDAMLAEWLPQSDRSTIPGVGHFLQMQDPHSVAETLATFLEGNPMG
jgi:pimeloyl-ACP methyl ester carboxylesterase